jgi:Uma2 family endonuclease
MQATTIQRSRNGTPKKTERRPGVPQLLNGDHLTAPEFERRYEAVQEDQRAELIEGIVVMSPPISSDHGKANSLFDRLLGHYATATPRTAVAVNTSVRMDGRNEYQPDVMLWIETGNMSRLRMGANGVLEGRPELAVEIALSSRSYDLHEKKAVYQRNQVPEYVVWEVMDARIQWFILKKGEYVLSNERADGLHCSRIFPGLWLNLRALVSGDDKKVFRALDRGLKSAGHKMFVKQLAKS